MPKVTVVGRDLWHMRDAPVARDTACMLKMILVAHVAGGSTALLSMFVPMLTKKGGRTHRRAGWVFVAGMTVVSITALVLSAARFLFDSRPEAQAGGVFLFYVAILTGAGVSAGMRALRTKRRAGSHTHPWDIGLAALLTASGVAMAAYGIVMRMPLFMAFSLLGIVNGAGQLRYWLRPPQSPMHWWYEHMSGMLGSCIAAVTAFLVINAGNLGLPRTSLIVWLTPGLIGGPAVAIWRRYYRRRFESGGGRLKAAPTLSASRHAWTA
jgi:hypothetical protein